jgi:3-isopropylmalate dehydratase small subunit
MIIQGKVVKYGDNVNTDVIIPSKYPCWNATRLAPRSGTTRSSE